MQQNARNLKSSDWKGKASCSISTKGVNYRDFGGGSASEQDEKLAYVARNFDLFLLLTFV
jgi:hypothetical protein